MVLNKVDLMKKEDLLPIIADYSSMHDFASIVPVSAKNNDGVDILLHDIEGLCLKKDRNFMIRIW